MRKNLFAICTLLLGWAGASAATIYVNAKATGANDGTSWKDAYTELADAIINASAKDHIWVAQGTYMPKYTVGDTIPADPRKKEFVIREKDLSIYGGFAGVESNLNERNFRHNKTILSGDIGGERDMTDNCYSVFDSQNSSFVLDGFTITHGNCNAPNNNSQQYKTGAGIYVYNSDTNTVLIENCIIEYNFGRSDAGIFTKQNGGELDIRVVNCRISHNVSRWASGVSMFASKGILRPALVNCLIDNNRTSEVDGGRAGGFPAGRFIHYTGNSTKVFGKVINCTFTQNLESKDNSLADKDRATFGIQGAGNQTEIHNSIFYGNPVNIAHTSIGYGNNSKFKPDTVQVHNVIAEDSMQNLTYVEDFGITNQDPMFNNPNKKDFTLQANSDAVGGGEVTGISQYIPNKDLAGNNRYYYTIDLGCYEYSPDNEPLSLSEATATQLGVYPNPTSNWLTLSGVENIASVNVFNLSGKNMQVELNPNQTNQTNQKIDVSTLPQGVYIIKVQAEGSWITRKFLKQ